MKNPLFWFPLIGLAVFLLSDESIEYLETPDETFITIIYGIYQSIPIAFMIYYVVR